MTKLTKTEAKDIIDIFIENKHKLIRQLELTVNITSNPDTCDTIALFDVEMQSYKTWDSASDFTIVKELKKEMF